MTKQIPLSLSLKRDTDVLDHLQGMSSGVRSNYIRELIRADMRGQSLEERIRAIVREEMNSGDADVSATLRGLLL